LEVVAAVTTNGESAGTYESAVVAGPWGALALLLEPHPTTSAAEARAAKISVRRI
jgi:hypothetical protein